MLYNASLAHLSPLCRCTAPVCVCMYVCVFERVCVG